jgi:hypothetical protein
MPPTRCSKRNARPRCRVNSFRARARSESPRHSSRLHGEEYRVPSHLSRRNSPQDYYRYASAPDRVARGIDRVLHTVRRCSWRRKARTLAALPKPTHGGVLGEHRVHDRDGSSGGQRRVSRLEAQSRTRRILIRDEHPWTSVGRHDGQRPRRGGNLVGASLSATAESEGYDDGTNTRESNAMNSQALPDLRGIPPRAARPVLATAPFD